MGHTIKDKVYEKGIVYVIVNKSNRDVYIGSTIQTLEARWYNGDFSHKKYIETGVHRRLYDSIRKYGVSNFDYYEIDSLVNCKQYDIQLLEDYYIKQFIKTFGRYKVMNMMDNAFTNSDASQMHTKEVREKVRNTIQERYGGFGNIINEDAIKRRAETSKHHKSGIFREDNYKTKSHVYLVEGKVFYGLTDLTKGLQDMGYDLSYGVVHHLACSGYASKRTLNKYPNALSLIKKINKNEWKEMEEYKL